MNNLFSSVQLKEFKVDNRSDRIKLLEGIMKDLSFYSAQNFKGLLMQSYSLSEREIQSCYDTAKPFKTNPVAFFRKLIKEKVAEKKNGWKPYTPLLNCTCDYCNYYKNIGLNII